jgi:hypothetical protein
VPWQPELFSAPVLARLWEDDRRRRFAVVPFFAGLMTGQTGALIDSFAREPELHHPIRGRVKGIAPFERFVTDTNTWLAAHNATVEDVDFILTPRRGVEELVLHLHGDDGRVDLLVAIAADRDAHAGIAELRIYFSTRPLIGTPSARPPLLQPDPDLHAPDIVGDHQRALAAGDIEATVTTFAPDGYLREPTGPTHHGTDALRALYQPLFSNRGAIPLELCAITDDGRACALEYNTTTSDRTELPHQPGLTTYTRANHGKLAAARIYDDTALPLNRLPM